MYFHGSVRKHLRRRKAGLITYANSGGSSYHLNRSKVTVVAFASLAECRYFLPTCDHRLENFIGVQIVMG